MGALLRVCAPWVAEIVGRMGIAFELIEWPAGEGLRGLNDGISSWCGLVGALMPDYLYSAPLRFNYRQSLEDYFANRGSRVVIGFEGN